MSATVETSEAAIWNRVVDPEAGGLTREAAESLLRFRLPEADQQRVNELAEKARQGVLVASEQVELETYRHVGRLLELLKSKARQSLKRLGNPA
jgi:sulfite reductase alpha subunit-like flavoprotein